MGKFLVLAGGIVAGGGFVTGVAGLTVLGMTDSESDIIRKRMEIDREKLKIQGKIIETEKEIKDLEEKKKKITEAMPSQEVQEARKKANEEFKKHFLEELGKINVDSDECKVLDLNSLVKKTDNDAWKNEEWFTRVSKEFNGKTRFGKQCKEII